MANIELNACQCYDRIWSQTLYDKGLSEPTIAGGEYSKLFEFRKLLFTLLFIT